MSPAENRSKYQSANLLPALKVAARFRRELLGLGFTDNGGAIHSAERILNILGQRLKHPGLSHINNLNNYQAAEKSAAAHEALLSGHSVQIEHVAPLRALTVMVLDLIEAEKSDLEVEEYVRQHYRLVLLTREERQALDRNNRTKLDVHRLEKAGIAMFGSS